MWSKETRVGLVAKVYFKNKIVDRVDYIPIDIKDYGQAEVMPKGLDRDKLLNAIVFK